MFCSPVPRIPEQTESYNENNNKEYLASGGYPQTQVIIDGKLGQATGRGTGGSVTIIVRSYVRTVSDWDAWYFQASGSCQCLVEDHTYLLYNFGIFPFYDFWDFGCHTELDVNGLAPKISNNIGETFTLTLMANHFIRSPFISKEEI